MWANQPVWCKALSRLVLKRFATFLGNVFVNRPLWCKALSRLVLVLQQLHLPPKSDKLPPEKKIIPKLDISQTFRTLKKTVQISHPESLVGLSRRQRSHYRLMPLQGHCKQREHGYAHLGWNNVRGHGSRGE